MRIWIRRVLKYVVLPLAVLLLVVGGLFVLLVGPWPTYADSEYRERAYFADTLARLDASLAQSEKTAHPGRLHAGWAERAMDELPPGTPLAGYSARPNEKRSTGTHDPVYARAIVMSDGVDTVALAGCDMLMTTLNLAQHVWAQVGAATPLTPDDILFTTSHTHCGPGGFAPGLLAEYSAGEYDPAIEAEVSGSIADAIIEAYEKQGPASLAHGRADAPEYIENRTRMPVEDASLRFMLLRKESGETCYAVRYSAHPTVLPQEFLELSAEYPGALCKRLREKTGAMPVFLGGAVGAMGPVAPEGGTPVERMRRMGEALADKVLANAGGLAFKTHLDILSAGGRVDMPPMQARPFSAGWRLSPLFAHIIGLPPEGWIQAVRAGDLVFLGLPYDSGGEIAQQWAEAAAVDGYDLWVSSHCIAYCGYLSPDRYYMRVPKGYDQHYEWRLMNWFGPNQEALYTDLKEHLVAEMMGKPGRGGQG